MTEKSRRKPAVPDGFKDEASFLRRMREDYCRAITFERDNRDAMRDDIRFAYGDQWEPESRRRRRNKPTLTINRIPAYVAQVIGNRLLNETDVRVFPDHGGTKGIAELREALIRSIFKNSDSDLARDEALKYQVICGVGYYALETRYSRNDVFEQDIYIRMIPDPFSVVMDELSIEPTGRDARWAIVAETLPLETFKARYPWASTAPVPEDTMQWVSGEDIRIASYWRMVEKGIRTLALMTDGTVKEIDPDAIDDLVAQQAVVLKDDGTPYVRDVPNVFAQMYLCSGNDILEGPFDLPCSTIPVFRVPGWELRDGEKYIRWGLVRHMKDPQRLHNYWRSVLAEQLVMAPRNKWAATREAVAGFENEWRAANVSDDALLIFNAEGGMPQRIPPPPLDGAVMNEAMLTVQDMRDVSNIHEAALGIKSNEVSGKAIQARQQISDLGTFIYTDRLRMADQRCAEVINELIPTVYDTTRVAKIVGRDSEAVLAVLNDPSDPNSDVTVGRYAITVTTGPSSVTRKVLAAEQMMAFVNAVPQSASLVMDLIAEAQEWPKADEFARRFAAMLPDDLKPENATNPSIAAMKAQQEQMQAMLALEAQKAELELKRAKVAEALARAENLRAGAEQNLANARARENDVRSRVVERAVSTAMDVSERTDDD